VAAKDGFEVYELRTDDQGNLTRKEPVIQEMDVGELRTIALSPEIPEISSRICAGTGTRTGRLRIWDIRRGGDGRYILTPQAPHELSLRGHNRTALDLPSAVAFSHDSSRICVGTTNRHIHIYNLGEDGWSLLTQFELRGDFGTGISQFIGFTAMAFLSENQIAITTDSRFPAGGPAVFTLEGTRTAVCGETLDAQSLAVSPSQTRLVFVDSRKRRVILVGSSGRKFSGGLAVKTHVANLEHGSNPFIAALGFTRLELADNSEGLESFLVMDRMGTIQLFSCNT